MSTPAAAGTRRSLLHDVLSHAEVVELGLDGSVDDVPPLTTRLTPSSARAVLLFAWCYFFAFWGAAAVVIRSVLTLHADNLLPGSGEFIFVAVFTVLLVSAEFGVYYHLKAVNPVPSNSGPMGSQFSPSPFCTLAHFTLSATSRVCSFLELLFLLHTLVLPAPLLFCAGFTVSITVGALPFVLQLRCLLSCAFGDCFDPLQPSTCLPLASLERRLLRCGRLCLSGVAKGARGALCHLRRVRGRLGGVVRRGTTVSPVRRVEITCCDLGTDSTSGSSSSNSHQTSSSCQASWRGTAPATLLLQAERPLDELGAPRGVCKDPLVAPGQSGQNSAEYSYSSAEGDMDSGACDSFTVSSCEATTTAGWNSGEQHQQPPAAHTPRALEPLSSSGRLSEASSRFPLLQEGTDSQGQISRRQESLRRPAAPQYIPPMAALGLANCLLLLDLPGLTLHFKANFLPLQQLEAHEFLTSMVSLVRLYSGDFCMLLYTIFGLCTFGGSALLFVLLTFLLLKLKASCTATLLAHMASVFGLWDSE
ncbi:hypothetical protein, conserved [Eimeria maxima]|uniref:Transmembrane protein n=1 Tax=Eimeria maxima TaxID=5804 RepID=U6MD38_EIMMA|nr:hypothetical protein, conserved [Eimeria maxima]CDJ60988.1 hypothetical protein, conserved [Eimeria maxima]